MSKIENFKCDILSNFQTICESKYLLFKTKKVIFQERFVYREVSNDRNYFSYVCSDASIQPSVVKNSLSSLFNPRKNRKYESFSRQISHFFFYFFHPERIVIHQQMLSESFVHIITESKRSKDKFAQSLERARAAGLA